MTPRPKHCSTTSLPRCLAATQDCLARSRAPYEDDGEGHLRRTDLDYVAKLMKASAG